jgi:hypothetical protein
MQNKWVDFVRKWAKKHNQTYMCAASKQKCRDAYHAANPKSKTQKKRALLSPATMKKHEAMTRKAKHLKKKTQKELLEKFKPYAEHRKAKGIDVGM